MSEFPATPTAWTVLLLMTCTGTAADPARQAADALYDGIRRETLANGLQILVKPIAGSPVVTVMTAYKVGAADEDLTATGLSHYLEHLMFKGTDKLRPGDIDRLTQRAGGHNNAWTSEDLTAYHFDFAADRWQTALDIEADRMRGLCIDAAHEFEQEKGAVISELEGGEDQPFEAEHKAILPMLFGADAPYGHPVIGERDHVRGATAAVIKAHYDRWYHPNNAVIVVCGGVDAEEAVAAVRAKFAAIPAGQLPPRKADRPVKRATPARLEMPSKFEVPRMVMGFNTVRAGDPDQFALDVLQQVLAGGKTGRLYRLLVEDEAIATDVTADHSAGRYPGWFAVELELLPGQSREKAEELVLAELRRLAAEPVAADELKRAVRQFVSGSIFHHESPHNLAESLATATLIHGSPDHLREYLPKVAALTPSDLQAAARKYLDVTGRAVVWSVPAGNQGGTEKDKRPRRTVGTSVAAYDLRSARRVVLPNGLTLLLLENHRLPIVVASAHVRGVRLSEPADKSGVAAMTGDLLDEGAADLTGRDIARRIEDVGGSLELASTGGTAMTLSPDWPLGLELLLTCLQKPTFPADALGRVRAELLAAIDEAQRQPATRAHQEFFQAVYGPHPFGRPANGRKEVVRRLTAADCREFHAAAFVPNRTVLAVVGDFAAADAEAAVARLTAEWKPGGPVPSAPPVPPPAAGEKIIPMADAAQLYVALGHSGVRRDTPDYFSLVVMDHILGTGSGFTDRLSMKLRDRLGLAYSVSANIAASSSEEPGVFLGSIGTFPDKLELVKAAYVAEMRRLRREPPSAEELEDVKRYLLGSLPFRLTTADTVAGVLLAVERFQLGFDYFDVYRRGVSAVTPDMVRAAAEKYLNPDALTVVVVGPVGAKAKPR